MLHNEHLDDIVCRELNLDTRPCNLDNWNNMLNRIALATKKVEIALVGKYTQLHDAYLSVMEALKHGGWENGCQVKIRWVDSEQVTRENVSQILEGVDGILVPGGFGDRGIEGMIEAAIYAMYSKIPYLGICLGMQIAVMGFAREKLGWEDANSSEFDKKTKHPVIDLMPDQVGIDKKGGTMRLGSYPCKTRPGTLLRATYSDEELIHERHRHRYEFNNIFREDLVKAGLIIGGTSPDDRLVESIELKDHPFYLGVQFHPEFKSRPTKANPCFHGFLKAASAYSDR